MEDTKLSYILNYCKSLITVNSICIHIYISAVISNSPDAKKIANGAPSLSKLFVVIVGNFFLSQFPAIKSIYSIIREELLLIQDACGKELGDKW